MGQGQAGTETCELEEDQVYNRAEMKRANAGDHEVKLPHAGAGGPIEMAFRDTAPDTVSSTRARR